MTDNSLHLNVAQRFEPVREKNVDMDADIRVDVNARLTGLGIAGVAATALGAVATLVGGIVLAASYEPSGTAIGPVEATVLLFAAGVTLLFLGASMYFHGRTVLGAGSLERIHFDTIAEPDGRITVRNPGPGIASFAGATQVGQVTWEANEEDPWSEVQA